MAFTEFCCRSGGSNLNAGTRTGSSTEPGTAADLTYASGTWVASTGVFTVAAGDPVADGVAVGDFASVYADGSTVTGFVGRVTARDTTTITVSLSAKAGTAPTDGTLDRTVKIGGAWQGPNAAVGFPFGFITGGTLCNSSRNSPRVNMKNDADYSITAVLAHSVSGAVYFEGYATAYGDDGQARINGGGTVTGTLVNCVAAGVACKNIIVYNNSTAGNNSGLFCGLKIRCVADAIDGAGLFGGISIDCIARNCGGSGGIAAIADSFAIRCVAYSNLGTGFAAATPYWVKCISWDNGSHGFDSQNSGGNGFLTSCDAYDNVGDGFKFSKTNQGHSNYMERCNAVSNGAYGINVKNLTTHPASLIIRKCGFGSGTMANTSGDTNIDSGTLVEEGTVTYPANQTPWNDPDNGDFAITLAEAIAAGDLPFQSDATFDSLIDYLDIGAAQHQESGGSGGPSGFTGIRGISRRLGT